MDVIILDKNFLPLAPVNSMQTLIWDRRAKEPGMFELHCGASDFEAIEGGAYVYRKDRDELGVIHEANLGRNEKGARVCYAKGYFAEVMLDDRVVDTTENLNGTPEEISRKLVEKYFVNATGYAGRAVANIVLGAPSGDVMEKTKVQVTGKPVGTAITGIEEPNDLMHRLVFDGASGMLSFVMHKGYDRGAIFSDEYSNIRSASYHRDSTDAPNVVFVAGAGEGADRKKITIDLRDSPAEYAREMYVDARDLQQSWEEDGVTKYYTDEDYAILLENRGMEKVAGHKVLENFQIDADPTANLVYREDYDIGDWCTVRVTVHDYLKFELQRQITAIRETYEAGKMSIAITFGNYGPRSLSGYVARSVSVNEVVPSAAAGGGEDLSKLETEDKRTLVGATNEVNGKVGDLGRLQTTAKDSAVDAINELEEDVGNTDELEVDPPPEVPEQPAPETPTDLTGAVNSLQAQIGALADLGTEDKSNLVAAINEAAQSGGGGGGGGAVDIDYCLPVTAEILSYELKQAAGGDDLAKLLQYLAANVSGLSLSHSATSITQKTSGVYFQKATITIISTGVAVSVDQTSPLTGVVPVPRNSAHLDAPRQLSALSVHINESGGGYALVSKLTSSPEWVTKKTVDGKEYHIYRMPTFSPYHKTNIIPHTSGSNVNLVSYSEKDDLSTGDGDEIMLAFKLSGDKFSAEKGIRMMLAGWVKGHGTNVDWISGPFF